MPDGCTGMSQDSSGPRSLSRWKIEHIRQSSMEPIVVTLCDMALAYLDSDRTAVIEECAKICDGRAIKKGRDDECVNEPELCAALIRELATPTQTECCGHIHRAPEPPLRLREAERICQLESELADALTGIESANARWLEAREENERLQGELDYANARDSESI